MLVCMAHPDDESFGMGGTIAYYAQQGVEVHLICATRGEAGTVDEKFMEGHESIAQVREKELACAAEVLGLASVIYLDYRDSGMIGSKDNDEPGALVRADVDEVAAKIVGEIRRLQPEVVVTFDAVGGYHHPDHIAIHDATVRAFHAAGEERQFPEMGKPFAPGKLFFSARSRRALRFLVRLMPLLGKDPKKLGRNEDIDLTRLAEDGDTPPHVTINYRAVLDKKQKADACHASQLSENGFGLLSTFWRLSGPKDRFTRAHPKTADRYRARDLFAD